MIQQFTLTNEHIDRISEIVEGFLAEAELEQKNILRTRFAIEETLLNYQETLGTNGTVKVNCVKRFGRIRVELSVPGNRFDPFDTGAEDDSEVMRGILAGMGIAPSWNYKNGVNLVVFTPQKKQRSQMVTLALSIVLALAVGGLCYLLPDGVRLFLNNSLIIPLFNTFMGFLSAIAGPMIFLSVAWGIYSIGDTATFGKIGKRMITRFLVMSLVVTVVSAMVMLPFFSLSMGGAASFDFSELLNMVLDIIPDNLFTPFTEGNPMQIIFVAVLLGVAMLVMGSKTAVVASFVEQANYLIQLIMGVVSSLIPFFVFGSILNMILSDNFSALVESYKLIPLMILGDVLVLVIYIAMLCIKHKVSPTVLIKKLFPTFLIGLTTASSAAAFATNVECCEKDLGIDKKIINFGIPLGQVVFMPGAAILFLAAGLCMAEVYGIAISPSWLITALLIIVVLAVAAPPVPGGALTCYTILFLQLNIPAEAIAIVIALNVVLEFVATAVNLSCLQMELVELSASLDMLDREKLLKAK